MFTESCSGADEAFSDICDNIYLLMQDSFDIEARILDLHEYLTTFEARVDASLAYRESLPAAFYTWLPKAFQQRLHKKATVFADLVHLSSSMPYPQTRLQLDKARDELQVYRHVLQKRPDDPKVAEQLEEARAAWTHTQSLYQQMETQCILGARDYIQRVMEVCDLDELLMEYHRRWKTKTRTSVPLRYEFPDATYHCASSASVFHRLTEQKVAQMESRLTQPLTDDQQRQVLRRLRRLEKDLEVAQRVYSSCFASTSA